MSGLPNKGNVSIHVLFVLAIMLVFCTGAMTAVSSVRNYTARLVTRDMKRNAALGLLREIQNDFIFLKDDDADSALSKGVQRLKYLYAAYDFQIRDISSGINVKFLSDFLIEKDGIQRLIQSSPDINVVRYGWAHNNIISEKAKNRIKNSFGVTDDEKLFPVINGFPMTNIHYLSEECLEAFLDAYEVKNAGEKAYAVFQKVQTETVTDIESILDIKKGNGILNLIGCKTTFWEITFRYSGCDVRAVFCAVPDRKKAGKIDAYRLIERSVHYNPGG